MPSSSNKAIRARGPVAEKSHTGARVGNRKKAIRARGSVSVKSHRSALDGSSKKAIRARWSVAVKSLVDGEDDYWNDADSGKSLVAASMLG